jgi:hypothetical protein
VQETDRLWSDASRQNCPPRQRRQHGVFLSFFLADLILVCFIPVANEKSYYRFHGAGSIPEQNMKDLSASKMAGFLECCYWATCGHSSHKTEENCIPIAYGTINKLRCGRRSAEGADLDIHSSRVPNPSTHCLMENYLLIFRCVPL